MKFPEQPQRNRSGEASVLKETCRSEPVLIDIRQLSRLTGLQVGTLYRPRG